MTPAQLAAVAESYNETKTTEDRTRWEMVRTLAAITIQPHVSKPVKGKDLIAFPWDDEEKGGTLTREEARRRYEQLKKALHNGKTEHDQTDG